MREAVYQCIQHLAPYYPTDESVVQLLMDAFICEDAIRLPSAFQALLAVLKPHQSTSQWELRLVPKLQSGSRLIDDLQLKGILPFSGNVIDSSGWCFIQQRNKANKDLCLLCYCLLHAIWGTNIQRETDFTTKQMLLLCERNEILEWVCSILINDHVSIPHCSILSHSKDTQTTFNPSKNDVDQCLHNDSELRLIKKSVVSIVKHYPDLSDELVPKLDISPIEHLVQLINEKITQNLSEDGLGFLGITHSVDMISLILLQKHVRQYVERKNEIIQSINMQHEVESYLFTLNQYYDCANSGDKSYLKTVLSEFHHVLPNLSSFLFTLVCCSVPLLSSVISSRILSNVCRIPSETNCLRAVTILLKRLSRTDQCQHVQKALSELILRGLEGTEQDQIKSIFVLKAEIRGFEDNSFVRQDLIKVIDYVCDTCPVLSDTHPVITELQQCITDSNSIPSLSQHICDILLEGKSASSIVHSVDLLLALYQHSSILLDNLYQLLLGVNTRFSSFNSNIYVHSRLLRILSILYSFEGLEPTFEDREKSKSWESARKEYELFSHRIPFLFRSMIVGFDHYSLPFTPLVPLRSSFPFIFVEL